MDSTKESTAVFVKMDQQPLNPPFSARVENGELWWELNERDNWHRDDNNKPPYKPGDTVREREEWMLSAFIDVGAQYGQVCDEENARSMKYVLQYRDDDGDWFTARTIWPRDKDYAEARKLVTCYADECRERPAEEMPAWAIRPRVVKSIEPVMRDGVWWWRVGV